MTRQERLMPDGAPRWIRCYDNGGPDAPDGSVDRYTVIYTNLRTGYCMYVGMSGAPFHPQGVCQHGEHDRTIDHPRHGHLGRRIEFKDLPPDCQRVVIHDYREIWQLKREDRT
jgi:hypothetical protein